MTTLFERAGAAFLRAFGPAFLIYAPGIWTAPDLHTAGAIAVAATAASIAAGLRAVQVFAPVITWASIITNKTAAALADSFTRAFAGTAIVGFAGFFDTFDLSTWKIVVTGILAGALTAGVRALQGFGTKGESPAINLGFSGKPKAITA